MNEYITYGAIGLFIVISISVVIYFIIRAKNTVQTNEALTNQNTSYEALAQQITELQNKSGQPGVQGPVGEPGQQGPPGGTFQNQGVLRNLSATSQVLDRFFGSGKTTGVYLNTPSYASNQYWTLTADGLIQNQYGSCLAGDSTIPLPSTPTSALNTFMGTCDKSSTQQKWIFDKNGRLYLSNAPDKCLSTFSGSAANYTPAIDNQQPSKKTNPTSIVGVGLQQCDNTNYPLTQQWAFY